MLKNTLLLIFIVLSLNIFAQNEGVIIELDKSANDTTSLSNRINALDTGKVSTSGDTIWGEIFFRENINIVSPILLDSLQEIIMYQRKIDTPDTAIVTIESDISTPFIKLKTELNGDIGSMSISPYGVIISAGGISGTSTISSSIIALDGTFVSPTDTIADGDTTPDVSGGNSYVYIGTSSITVTTLDNEVVDAIYEIRGGSDTFTVTINDGGNFYLNGNVNFTMGIYDNIYLKCVAIDTFVEVSRSNN